MESPQQSIFRKAALDKLSSPEQLDQLMQVTTPKSWFALGACGVLVLTALVWGIAGSIRTTVAGRGILVRSEGVYVATSRGDGNVLDITKKKGVKSNDVLVVVSQPELLLKIKQAQEAQERLTNDLEALQVFQAEETNKEAQYELDQTNSYHDLIRDYTAQIASLEQRVKDQREAFDKIGAVSKIHLLETSNSLFAVHHETNRAQIQLEQLALASLQAAERRRQQIKDKELQIQQGTNQLEYLHQLYELNSRILSPIDGTVLEIMVKPGQFVAPNTPLLSLERTSAKLEAYLFLNPSAGKQVFRNMDVRIAPASVKKERFGLVKGSVVEVSPFPATPQMLFKVLENQALVAEFSLAGAPIAVRVWLNPDNTAGPDYSGYEWTSGKGPKLKLTSGTLCEGTIETTNQQPITLVLPSLKKSVGM